MMVFPIAVVIACPAVLVLAASSFAVIYLLLPATFFKMYMRLSHWRAGFTIKTIKKGEWTFCYAEKGQPDPNQPSMLCFHGFTASKDQWVPIAQGVPKDVHIIALDMPGHGGTSRKEIGKDDVGIHTLARQAHIFAEVKGLTKDKIHVVGASLGGAIAGIYASMYPDEVAMVSMLCPAMKTPVETAFMHELRDGTCHLIPETPEEVQHMIGMCMYNKAKIPKQILKGILEIRKPYNEYFNYIYKENLHEENEELLANESHKITMPSQLIWGAHDELIHPSGADVLREKLPDLRQVDIIEKCGHTMNMDRPGATTKAILTFRNKVLGMASKSSKQASNL